MPRTPPSGFDSAVTRAPVSADPISGGSVACAKLDAASNNSLNVSASSNNARNARTCTPPVRCTLQTFHEDFPIHVHWFWLTLDNPSGERPLDMLGSFGLHFSECGLIPRCQGCSDKTLPRSGDFSQLHFAARQRLSAPTSTVSVGHVWETVHELWRGFLATTFPIHLM